MSPRSSRAQATSLHQHLAPPHCLTALQVAISELQSSNKNTLRDEDGASSDWIELANLGTTPVNLAVRGTGGRLLCTPSFMLHVFAPCQESLPPQTCPDGPPHPPACPWQGYQLTDQQGGPAWTFPPGVTLVPGQYLVVFASGKDRRTPAAPLHTDFKLSSDDGYLALLTPQGTAASAVLFPEWVGCVGRVGQGSTQGSGRPW